MQPATSAAGSGSEAPLIVACLCAAWCDACRSFRVEFDAVERRCPEARFEWVDIEDHPEVAGDDDIATFPTLLIATDDGRGFFGAIEPRAATLHALVQAGLHDDAAGLPPSEHRARMVRAVRALRFDRHARFGEGSARLLP